MLLVTPSPSNRHQSAVVNLIVAHQQACPPGARVRTAPFDVTLTTDTITAPDVLVARAIDLDDAGLSGMPLLVVEVLSPGTRLIDLHPKRARYEAAGCPSYWIVDPDSTTLAVWECEKVATPRWRRSAATSRSW